VGIAVPRLVYPDGTLQTSIRTWPSPLTMLARRSPLGRTTVGRRILARHFLLDNPPSAAGPVPNAIGAAMLVRRGAITAVGPMDERIFLYGEDLDWCYRMWQHGWEVHVVPGAVMEHAYERQSRRTLDLRSAATRHHWASILKLFVIHPSLLIGRGPRQAAAAIARHRAGGSPRSRR
jgi:GT2 family glycosyltransferase